MSELFLSTWGGSRRTNGGGTEGERVNSSVQIWRGVQDQTSPHPLLQYLLLFHWLQCRGKLQVCTEKTAWGQNAWGGEEWLLSLQGHTHIQRERKLRWMSEIRLTKQPFSSLSLFFARLLLVPSTLFLVFCQIFFSTNACSSLFLFLSCPSLSLSLSVNLFPSVSLRLSLSVSSLYSDSRAAVPHICSAAQRPQRQKDVCAYTCECYMAKSMWTLLVSGFFHNWGSTA